MSMKKQAASPPHSLPLQLLLPLLLLMSITTWQPMRASASHIRSRHCHASLSICNELENRIEGHMASTDAARNTAYPAADEPSTSDQAPKAETLRRQLATAASVPIRISPVYQLPANMSASDVTKLKGIVSTAIRTLQNYFQILIPVGSTGLLVVPQTLTASQCNSIQASGSTTQTCSAAGVYPNFNASLPATDILAPYCGPALINASHVMGQACNQGALDVFAPSDTCNTSASGSAPEQTDLYIYVTMSSQSCAAGGGASAYALPCFFDLLTDRPTLSVLNWCPQDLMSDNLLDIAIHEITHSMGFISSFFSLYMDSSSGTKLGLNNVVATIPAASASTTTRSGYNMIITPTVVKEARLQFNCSSLAGAALEDQGGTGSAGSHWEFELFQGDLMISTSSADSGSSRLSRITLAVMQDSGWYAVNWTASSYLDWGRNAGCNLPKLTSTAYRASDATQPYFCSGPTAADSLLSTCSYNGMSQAVCIRVQKFAVCGMSYAPYSAGYSTARPTCINPAYYYQLRSASIDAKANPILGWAIGNTSRCYPLSSPVESPSNDLVINQAGILSWGTCWKSSCNSSGVLSITAKGVTLPCPTGGSIALSLFDAAITNGTLSCPNNTAGYCRTLQCDPQCDNTSANCFEGTCVCRLGYGGTNCSSTVLALSAGAPFIPPTPPPLLAPSPTPPPLSPLPPQPPAQLTSPPPLAQLSPSPGQSPASGLSPGPSTTAAGQSPASGQTPPAPSLPPPFVPSVILRLLAVTFATDYPALVGNATKAAQFRIDVCLAITAASNVPSAYCAVSSLSAGSVVADTTMTYPASSYTDAQASQSTSAASRSSSTFSASFLSTYSVSGTPTIVDVTPASAPADSTPLLSMSAIIGIAVGVGGAVLIAVVLGVAIAVKRRGGGGAAVSPQPNYQPVTSSGGRPLKESREARLERQAAAVAGDKHPAGQAWAAPRDKRPAGQVAAAALALPAHGL